jgi:hypothetical protein
MARRTGCAATCVVLVVVGCRPSASTVATDDAAPPVDHVVASTVATDDAAPPVDRVVASAASSPDVEALALAAPPSRWTCAAPAANSPSSIVLWGPDGPALACRTAGAQRPIPPPWVARTAVLATLPAWTCAPHVLWSPPAANPGLLGPIAVDASFVYVAQSDGCKDASPRPRGDGGVWRVDRRTGHAERIWREPEVRDLRVQGPTLWVVLQQSWCERVSAPKKDTAVVALPLAGVARPGRLDAAHDDAVASRLFPTAEGIAYGTRGGSVVGLDAPRMKPVAIAPGVPVTSATLGDERYFLESQSGADTTPGEVDLHVVPLAGGDARREADDLVDPGAVLQASDAIVLKTKDRGIRAYSRSGGQTVARSLVPGEGKNGTSVGDIAIARGAVVYVYGEARTEEIRAVPLAGGPSWQVAPPHRDPTSLVADDAGIYWVNLVDPDREPNRDGVFACEPRSE